jgi:hypothetical protein
MIGELTYRRAGRRRLAAAVAIAAAVFCTIAGVGAPPGGGPNQR